MARSIIKGKDLMIFVNGVSIGFATSHSLELSAETTDTATALATKDGADATWSEAIVSGHSWTASSENAMANDAAGKTFDDLFQIYAAGTQVDLIMGGKTATDTDTAPETGWAPKPNDGYTGKAIITSLSLNAANGDNATFSVQFQGVGAIAKVAQS